MKNRKNLNSLFFTTLNKNKLEQMHYQIFTQSNLVFCDIFHFNIKDTNSLNLLYALHVHIFCINRLMFFSDNYPTSRIEKAFLDGQDRVVIVHKGLLRVLSLTVDVAKNKLYWVDYDRQTLEVCDYNGSNRRVIRRIYDVSLTDITFHQVHRTIHYATASKNQDYNSSLCRLYQ